MTDSDLWLNSTDDPLDVAARFVKKTSKEHGGGAVETFHRRSSSMRVEWEASTGEVGRRIGREEGGALRWIDPRVGTLGFAAASGDVTRSFGECHAIAARLPGKPVKECPWNTAATSLEDLETAVRLPREDEILTWLRETTPASAESAWAEVAVTTETWLDSAEKAQKRVRSRAWAAWTPRSGGARPLFAAARSWAALRREDLAAAWRDRALEETREFPWPEDARLVFSAETSAFLARTLARFAHHPRAEPGSTVGPGWVLQVDSGPDPGSLFSSRVDDAGFPTKTHVLADGRQVVGVWGGPGSLRRGSFRDPPESQPLNLRLEPPRIDPPHRAAWVTDIELHPVADSWTVRLKGRRYPDGAAFRPRWVRLRPLRLLESCLGGIGPARQSHVGVATPALVFDELTCCAD